MEKVDLSFLRSVAKPTRYIGGEVNEVVKPDGGELLHVALAFPDLYDIGMSYMGLSILYSAVNKRDDAWAERVFMPWLDMEAEMEGRHLPLYGLESKRPLAEFDVIGFTLQFELTYTNILQMLRLGGIPWRSSDRNEGHPLVIAGGPCAVNPEPLAPFIDAFFIGDGEEGFGDILDVVKAFRGKPRSALLRELSRVEGVYVPALYVTEPGGPSAFEVVTGAVDGAPLPVRKRILWNLDSHPFPAKVLVPHHEVVHDRYSIEIARGCSVGCRFCQAGYIYRPARERSFDEVFQSANDGLASTGFNEISLLSLNAGEYSGIENLVRAISTEGSEHQVGVSMPSLRVSALTRELAKSLGAGRKSGFTLAPEAGTQRLRNVVNKQITEADVMNAASVVFSSGWNLVKLYFMIGLPTETEEDLHGIEKLAKLVAHKAREVGCKTARINLSTSSFVPKPFTPFQWCAMEKPENLRAKQNWLKDNLRRPVTYKWHDVDASVIEAVLSLGDRRVANAIEEAARLGCRFDGWTEQLRRDLWQEAFKRANIDVAFYLHRDRAKDEPLPWDHIDVGVRKDFLWREWQQALAAEPTNKCGADSCYGCGFFAKQCMAGEFERSRESEIFPSAEPSKAASAETAVAEISKYRLTFSKTGTARFLGHLDLVDVLVRALRRAGVALAYSKGFHPMPKVELPSPLPLGVEGLNELMEFEALSVDAEKLLGFLRSSLPRGLAPIAIAKVSPGLEKLGALRFQRYEIDPSGLSALEREALIEKAAAFQQAATWPVEKVHKGQARTYDLKERVKSLSWKEGTLRVTLETGGFMDLVQLLAPANATDRLSLRRLGLTAACGDIVTS
ncbi:MAG: TIGR03960 family B12-binding radical SAM protein [Acidobacteria bacterium]|nr:TIGR03960 family B12-binding radical SAM protein [Acidobacteriota bacterium]